MLFRRPRSYRLETQIRPTRVLLQHPQSPCLAQTHCRNILCQRPWGERFF
eukprot:TRINITY_DN20_c0_g1_i2.p1 TRINITY_DN20_c0_g1~~TRINITY_DN20_c0_g1_i2.p1  ORF type:complete len:50 (+),score=5.00 TRINITY_DN20_c0_g1_i2:255-404(+)